MVAIWRGFIWMIGSVSAAVLLQLAFDVRLAPFAQRILDEYDRGVAIAAGHVEPWVAAFLPVLHAAIGGGLQLQPHWTHVFLVVFLHLSPRGNATYGVGDLAAAVLKCLQAVGAILFATVAAAFVGAAPFVEPLSEEGFFVGVFIASALCISVASNFRVSEEPADQARYEASDAWWSRSRTRQMIVDGFAVAVVLAIICLGMVGLMLGWLDVRSAEFILLVVGLAIFVAVNVRGFYRFLFSPRDEADDFIAGNSAMMNIALSSMVLVLLPLADHLSPRQSIRGPMWMILLAAVMVTAAHYFGRKALWTAVGRSDDASEAPSVPALGVFIAGGATILFASSLLQ
ncbi:MAG: hypothetical protein JNK07_18305 [Alphaproteobacteria bacterium]|nr:hypothetical protein [Alphaproteobacteria bacterium]